MTTFLESHILVGNRFFVWHAIGTFSWQAVGKNKRATFINQSSILFAHFSRIAFVIHRRRIITQYFIWRTILNYQRGHTLKGRSDGSPRFCKTNTKAAFEVTFYT